MDKNVMPSHLWETYAEEVLERMPEFQKIHQNLHATPKEELPTIRRTPNGTIAGSTGLSDCIYLYLLVRELKPNIIFEIGTWIGTSSMFMAEALKKNGAGHIYTCDINIYYALGSSYDKFITFVNAPSEKAIDNLPRDTQIDFCFIDGSINRPTLHSIAQHTHSSTTLTTHDVKLPDEKGVLNLAKLIPQYPHHEAHLPKPLTFNGITVNNSTGILAPNTSSNNILTRLGHVMWSYLLAALLTIFYYTSRLWYKINNMLK
ncbi:MAG: class I SAM-dependent methyltransferase [Candidatus Paceibacterota bacterium]